MFEVVLNVLLCIAMLETIVVVIFVAVMGIVECINIVKDANKEWREKHE